MSGEGGRSLARILLFLATTAPVAATEAPPASGSEEAIAVLNEVWDLGRERIYPPQLVARFDDATRAALASELEATGALLGDVLNPFLRSLGVSHTEFFDTRHHGYYLLKSMFGTRDFDSPALDLIGIELQGDDPTRVRAVLDGLPAARAGLRPGDRILRVDGDPFASLLDWQARESIEVDFDRGGTVHTVAIRPERMSVRRALLEATRNSRREYRCESTRITYLHLWSGTDEAYLGVLVDAAAGAADAFVLDLRDGYGGAWWPYLDPFFADRTSYFAAEISDRSGTSAPMRAEPRTNPHAFSGPLAVLVNSGTRSGKESLAHQFKRSGRGRLFGTTTAGAFTAGQGLFADREAGYVMYLSVAEYRLDGTTIEAVGVEPDVRVEPEEGRDTVLAAALAHLGCEKPIAPPSAPAASDTGR